MRPPGPVWLQRFDDPGPASGPTVAVKDAIDVAGTVTTVGSRARADSPPAARDAACVAAVRRAGGRIVGKTNLTELCWFADGVNDWTGTPANPLDPARDPGGSSSGSAVAVDAAGWRVRDLLVPDWLELAHESAQRQGPAVHRGGAG